MIAAFATEEQIKKARESCTSHIDALRKADQNLCEDLHSDNGTHISNLLIAARSKKAGEKLGSLKQALETAFTQQGIETNQAAHFANHLMTTIKSEVQMQAVMAVAGRHDKKLYKKAFQANTNLTLSV